MVERQLGDLDAAEALAREALEIEQRTGDQFTTPFAISGLASIATERGESERAATLVGAAEAIMEAQQMAWPPDERPHYERLLADLPEMMGIAEFARARASGRSMATKDAVAFALRGGRSRLAATDLGDWYRLTRMPVRSSLATHGARRGRHRTPWGMSGSVVARVATSKSVMDAQLLSVALEKTKSCVRLSRGAQPRSAWTASGSVATQSSRRPV